MFIIFGDKHRTEPVDGGLEVSRTCPKCGEQAVFRERVVSKQFRVYFVEMFTHGTHHVLECSRCGTAFVTDEVKDKQVANDQSGTVYGHVQGFVERGREALESGAAGRALEQVEAEAVKAFGAAQEAVGGLLDELRSKRGKPSRDE